MDVIWDLEKNPNFNPRVHRGNIVNYLSGKPVQVKAPQQLVRSERQNSISTIDPPSQIHDGPVALTARPIAHSHHSGGRQYKFSIEPYTAPVAAGEKTASTRQVDVPTVVAGAKGGDLNPCFALGTFKPSRLGRDRVSLLYFPKKPQAPIPGGGFLEKAGNGYVHFHHYRGAVLDTKFAETVELRKSGASTTLKQLAYKNLKKNQTVLMLVPDSGLIPVTVGSVKNRFLEEEGGRRGEFLGLDIELIVSESLSALTKGERSKRPVLFDIHQLTLPKPESRFDFSTRTPGDDSKLPASDMSDPVSVHLHTPPPTAASATPTTVPGAGDGLTQLKPRTNALIPGKSVNPFPAHFFAENPGFDTPPYTSLAPADQNLVRPSAPHVDLEAETKRSLPPGTFNWTEPQPNSLASENRPAGTSESFAATAMYAEPPPFPAADDDLTQMLDAMPMPTLDPLSASGPQAPKKPALVLAGATGMSQAHFKPRTNALVPDQTFNPIPPNAYPTTPYVDSGTQSYFSYMPPHTTDDQHLAGRSAPSGASSGTAGSEPPPASVPAPMETPRETKQEASPAAGESGGVKTAGRLRLAEDWLAAKPFEAVTVGGRDFTFLKRQPQASDHGGIVTICRPALARDQVSNWESDVLGKSNPRVISISMTGARTLDQRDFYPKTLPEKVPSQLLGESMIVYDLHLAKPTHTPDPKLYQDPQKKD